MKERIEKEGYEYIIPKPKWKELIKYDSKIRNSQDIYNQGKFLENGLLDSWKIAHIVSNQQTNQQHTYMNNFTNVWH